MSDYEAVDAQDAGAQNYRCPQCRGEMAFDATAQTMKCGYCGASVGVAAQEGSQAIIEQDLFESDFSDATVVMMYLYPKVNRKLRPILSEQLAPGTRVVSHRYEIGGWVPTERVKVEGRPIFLYVMPPEETLSSFAR